MLVTSKTSKIISKQRLLCNANKYKDLFVTNKSGVHSLICHMHSLQPIVHGKIGISSVIIDGETHRGKLMDKETLVRISDILKHLKIADEALTYVFMV